MGFEDYEVRTSAASSTANRGPVPCQRPAGNPLLMTVVLCILLVASLFPIAAASQPASPTEGEGAAAMCLKCHGPFEKLASQPPGFVTPGGEKVAPHRYVPHDGKDIPDCTNCHQTHSTNPTAGEIAALPKPNVKFCFDCHHKENFQRCKTCHK